MSRRITSDHHQREVKYKVRVKPREACQTYWTWLMSDQRGINSSPLCPQLHVPLRLLCAALLFACNAIMWTFFSKALRHCSSSASATVTTTASNFISSVSSPLTHTHIHTHCSSTALCSKCLLLRPWISFACAGRPGEADIWREPRSSVVGGHLPHSVWPLGASHILGSDPPTGGQKRQVNLHGLIASWRLPLEEHDGISVAL